MSEQVPEGWKNLAVQDAFELGRGRVISKEEIRDNAGKYPVYSSQSTNNGKMGSINTYDFDGEYVTWTTDGAYAGTVFYRNGKFSCTNVCGTVRDKSSHQVDMKFISEYLSTVAKNHVSYVGNPKLMNGIFGEIVFLSPPLPEQKKIASILTSVDEVIEKTQSQVDKLQDLKKGTMNELLTKGIGHTEFKDSELGRIPKSWEVKRLIDLSVNGISNGVFNDPKKVGGGYKLINVTEMYQKFGFDEYKLKRISLDEKEFLKNKINYGDILFTRSSLVLEGIAHCNICLSHSDDITYDGHLMRVRPNKSIIDPVFLAYFAIINISRTFFMRMAKQSTMTTIGQEDIAPLPVLVPPLEEQIKIVSIISQMTKQSINLQKKLHQTKSLKKSLMQDLLTGRVRVSAS